MNIEQLMKENKGTVIDVRSPGEYMGGHVAGSVNIPLGDLQHFAEQLKTMEQPIVTCCASGMRSNTAATVLKNMGIDCYDGGSWHTINYYMAQAIKQ